MFLATIILSSVLQDDIKDFGFVRRSVANNLHILEDISNDVK